MLMHILNAADSKKHCKFWAPFSVQFPFLAVVAGGHVSHVAYLEIDRREVSTTYVTRPPITEPAIVPAFRHLDSAVVVTVMVSAETLVEELKNVIDSETAPGYVAQ
jgi:5-methylthioribose kinase